jgi:hypothetical protein
MTEGKPIEHQPGATFNQPGPSRSGDERAKIRNKARDAGKAAANAARQNKEVEDAETAKAIRNARKEAGK